MKFTFDTTRLKEQIEDNPLVAAGIGVALLNGVVKLMNAQTERKRVKVYDKETNRRIRAAK